MKPAESIDGGPKIGLLAVLVRSGCLSPGRGAVRHAAAATVHESEE
jgi:hypothetical protein